jgi:peptidoglycan/xylan/chitin deacetylase (PgdA/CDA1 family)
MSPSGFRQHIDAIEASGRTTLRITELAAALRDRRRLSEPVMAITFDDDYLDTYAAAIELRDRGFRSTVYVTTSEVDTRSRLASSQVAELAALPDIEFGAHAVHHRYLDELRDSELGEEIGPCKLQLEEITQRAVNSFAYPHGAYDKRVRQAVIDAGYVSAAAVKNAFSHPADDPYAIARWTVMADTSGARLAQILGGDHVPRAWARERARTRAYRAVRRGRRRLVRRAVAS